MPVESANIARHLPLMAARQPDQPSVKVPRGRTRAGDIDYLVLSFAELDAEVDAWCARLAGRGVRAGDRTLIMVRQGLPLIAQLLHPDRWLLWLGLLFILAVYFAPNGIVGKLRTRGG